MAFNGKEVPLQSGLNIIDPSGDHVEIEMNSRSEEVFGYRGSMTCWSFDSNHLALRGGNSVHELHILLSFLGKVVQLVT